MNDPGAGVFGAMIRRGGVRRTRACALLVSLAAGVETEALALTATLDTPRARQGSYVVLSVRGVARDPGAAVEVFGRRFPLFPAGGGLRAIIPVSLETVPGRHRIAVSTAKGGVDTTVRVLRRKRGPVRSLKSLTVTAATADSFKANREKFGQVVHRASPRALWSRQLRFPVPGRITARFGVRRSYGGGAKWSHKGVDFGLPAGSPVIAPAAGVVVISERMGSYGNTIVIDHGQTVFTTYLHLVSRGVRTGWRVEQGQVIGTVGATGLALGAHLHFGVLIDGVAVDPLEVLARGLP